VLLGARQSRKGVGADRSVEERIGERLFALEEHGGEAAAIEPERSLGGHLGRNSARARRGEREQQRDDEPRDDEPRDDEVRDPEPRDRAR
jgi:hypothetical protein